MDDGKEKGGTASSKGGEEGVPDRGGADELPEADRTVEGGGDDQGKPPGRLSPALDHPSLCMEEMKGD